MPLIDSFDEEFGSSDTQSNYSRLYSWMANQLGHMTLGLIVALFCYWSRETILNFFDVYATPPTDAGPGILFGDGDVFRMIDAYLLAVAMLASLALLATAVVFAYEAHVMRKTRALGHDASYVAQLKRMNVVKRTKDDEARDAAKPKLGRAILKQYRWIFLACALGGLALLLARDLFLGEMIAAVQGAGWWLAHLYPTAILAAALFFVSRNMRYVWLGIVMLAIATHLWIGAAAPDGVFGESADMVTAALFASFVLILGAGCDCRRRFTVGLARGIEEHGAELDEGDDSDAAWGVAAAGAALVLALGVNWTSDGPRFGDAYLPGHPAADAVILCAVAFGVYWALFRLVFREAGVSCRRSERSSHDRPCAIASFSRSTASPPSSAA